MANINAPNGFMPIGRLGGQCGFSVNSYPKTAAIIYQGDLVLPAATGDVVAAGATGLYMGTAMHYAAAAATEILICEDHDALFVAQATGATGLAAADMNLNANASFGSGSTTTLMSGHGVSDSTEAVTGTLDLKLIRKLPVNSNEWGAYVRVVVKFNKHRLGNQVEGL